MFSDIIIVVPLGVAYIVYGGSKEIFVCCITITDSFCWLRVVLGSAVCVYSVAGFGIDTVHVRCMSSWLKMTTGVFSLQESAWCVNG